MQARDNLGKIGGTSQIVISGESGGGNLCIATALKAKLDGKRIVSGVYSLCP
jgi:acetyl esterase